MKRSLSLVAFLILLSAPVAFGQALIGSPPPIQSLGFGEGAFVLSDAYGPGWSGDYLHSPSRGAVYQEIQSLGSVYELLGTAASLIAGLTASSVGADPAGTAAGLISDLAYGSGWNGDTTHAPSKNAVYDKISTLGPSDVGAAPTSHVHAASEVTSGTLDNARVNFAAPGAIGGTTPAAGTFTSLANPKQLGVAGQDLLFQAYSNSTDGVGWNGPVGPISATRRYQHATADPADGCWMLFGVPAAGISAQTWFCPDGNTAHFLNGDGTWKAVPVPDLSSPGAIGGGTPAAGTFTTLSGGGGGFAVDADGDTTGKSFGTPQAATSGDAQDYFLWRGYGSNGRGFYLKNSSSEPANTFGLLFPTTEPSAGQALVVSSFAAHEGQLGYVTPLGYPGAGIAVSATSSWGTSLAAPSGAIVGTTDTQTLSGKTLTAPKETVVTGGTCSTSYTPDLTAGSMVTLTLNGACQIDNPTLAAGESFIIKLTQSSTVAPRWGTAFKWAAGTAPTWSTSATKYDIVACTSFEGTALQCAGLIDVR